MHRKYSDNGSSLLGMGAAILGLLFVIGAFSAMHKFFTSNPGWIYALLIYVVLSLAVIGALLWDQWKYPFGGTQKRGESSLRSSAVRRHVNGLMAIQQTWKIKPVRIFNKEEVRVFYGAKEALAALLPHTKGWHAHGQVSMCQRRSKIRPMGGVKVGHLRRRHETAGRA